MARRAYSDLVDIHEPVPVDVVNTPLSSSVLDAFGRQRISNPVTIFDSQLQYGLLPSFLWESITNAGGTVAHQPNYAGATLGIVNTADSYAIRQSHRTIRYQPGKSQFILMTGILGTSEAGAIQRIGYFDDNNGIYFENSPEGLACVVRSNGTGSVVNTRVFQPYWNVDWLNGDGPSDLTLHPECTQIFCFDLEWLGVGSVRFGVLIDGEIVYCHKANHANYLTRPYMATANLPLRYEIRRTGALANPKTMLQICSTVISEGGVDEDRGLLFSVSSGIPSVAVTTRRPVLTIRPKTTFGGLVNRGQVDLLDVGIIAATNSCLVELVYNGT